MGFVWVSDKVDLPGCTHGWGDPDVDSECSRYFRAALDERYPAPAIPHGGFYKQDGPDGVLIMPCGGLTSSGLRGWGHAIARYLNGRDGASWHYTDFAWGDPDGYRR